MPPGLLDSQFETLEPPSGSEKAYTVSIQGSVEDVVSRIIRDICVGDVCGDHDGDACVGTDRHV